ncbi:MAG: PTS sugar transporter subunit IIC [Erysipelotrichaceae bacterium]|nr:PTS sugar transporter subunit IIC [Erysipelotrichaceae bacterium]
MEIQFWQIIALSMLAFFGICEHLSTTVLQTRPVIIGTIAGFIMGDWQTGLMVGASLQLMILGVGTFGGASIPDYMTGAIIGTAFAIMTGEGVEFAVGLAVPVGLLMVQLDILARVSNLFFAKRVDAAVERMDFKGITRNVWLGALPWGLSRALPVFLMLLFGQNIVELITTYVPAWLTGGLKVAGAMLPAVGIGVLLRYLPTKKYIPYLIGGFFIAAYLGVPVLGVAVIGMAFAIHEYSKIMNHELEPAAAGHGVQGGMEDDEFED